MTRATKVVLATVVWASGLVSVGALAYSYGDAPRAAVTVTAHHAGKTLAAQPRLAKLGEEVVHMPAAEILGRRSAPVTATIAAAPHQRDISEMTCSNWRELQQGSNAVRICD